MGLKLKLKLNLAWLKMPYFVFDGFNLIFLLESAHKDTMKLLDFKGCVNLFKTTWVAIFIQKRTHWAKIVACPPQFIFCKFDVIF